MSLHPESILNKDWAVDSFDVIFLVREEQFNMHTAMLLQNTGYYTSGTGDMSQEVVIMDNLEPNCFHIAVEYMYAHDDIVIMTRDAMEVYKVSVMLNYLKLRNHCLAILRECIDDEQAIELYRFHEETGMVLPQDFVMNHVLYNFMTISKLEKALTLPYSQVIELLEHRQLNISNEIMALQFMTNWCKHNPYAGDECLVGMLSCMKFEEMDIEDTVNEIYNLDNSQVYRRNGLVLSKLYKVWDECKLLNVHQKNGIEISIPDELRLRRCRICPDQVFITGGWNTDWATGEVDVFDPRAKMWYALNGTSALSKEYIGTISRKAARQPFRRGKFKLPVRSYHGQAVHNGLIYILGGMDQLEEQLDTVLTLDPANGDVNTLESMLEKRAFVSATSCKGVLYALGGHNGHRRLSTVEKFDEEINSWTRGVPMSKTRSDAACGTVNDKIYIVGGINQYVLCIEFECFNPDTQQWTLLAHINIPRSGISMAILDNNIYAIGGYDSVSRLDCVEMYDIDRNRWFHKKSMLMGRSNFPCFALEGKIHVVGGYNGISTTEQSEIYDPQTDTWEQTVSPRSAKSAGKACVVRGMVNNEKITYYGHNTRRQRKLAIHLGSRHSYNMRTRSQTAKTQKSKRKSEVEATLHLEDINCDL